MASCGFPIKDQTSLFDSTNKTIFDIDLPNTWLTKVFDSEFLMYSGTLWRYPICPHEHWWPLPIPTCFNVTHPVKSQHHQHWSCFVSPPIPVSLAKSPEILFTTNPKIHYWCAGSFSISFSNIDLVFLVFFNCYLAVPRPTLGHSQGDSLAKPKLIIAIFY